MRCCYLSSLQMKAMFLSSVALSFSEAARPIPSSSNPIARGRALELRGGGGWNPLVDGATTAIKSATALGLAVGTATALSTETVLDKCGVVENMDPMGVLTTRRIGGSILSFSIAAYLLAFRDATASTAVGVSIFPLILELSKALFDGTHRELGFPAEGQVMVLFSFVAFSFLFLNDSSPISSKDTLLKIHSGWLLFHGVLMGCFPSLALKTYGGMDTASSGSITVLQSVVSLWGFSLLSIGALSGCLATGMTTTKALALSALPFISRLVFSVFV